MQAVQREAGWLQAYLCLQRLQILTQVSKHLPGAFFGRPLGGALPQEQLPVLHHAVYMWPLHQSQQQSVCLIS